MALGPLTPTTELEAVNFMLRSIGLSQVNTLTLTGIPQVDIAVATLYDVSREVQTEGWWFNEEFEVTFPVDINNEILLPTNILSIDVHDECVNGVRRGDKLYNRDEGSFSWDSSQDCDVVYFIAFEEIPQVARNYILKEATFRLQAQTTATDIIQRISASDVDKALVKLEQEDDDNSDRNIFRNNESRLFNGIRLRSFNPR